MDIYCNSISLPQRLGISSSRWCDWIDFLGDKSMETKL